MNKNTKNYQSYLKILEEELVPAMGCTEPIALAYAAAKAREVLGGLPDRITVGASGSIIKNVKSVIVPNTNQLKGIQAAVAAGVVAGAAEKELEVISEVSERQTEEIKEFLDRTDISVECLENGLTFEILVTVYRGSTSAQVRIANYHTNIVLIKKQDEILFEKPVEQDAEDGLTDRSCMTMEDIFSFAEQVETVVLMSKVNTTK